MKGGGVKLTPLPLRKTILKNSTLVRVNDLTKRTTSDEILRDKAFNIARNPIYDEYQRGLVSMVYKFFDKKILAVVLKMKLFLVKN